MKLLFLVLLSSLVTFGWTLEDAPRVKTPLGAIKGYYKISGNGKQYEAYEGIPYALPPVGKFRFKAPQKIPAWIGELSATKFGFPCLQYTQLPVNPRDKIEGAEDCLYLNVYVPADRTPSQSLPVIFWIHGGAFQFGSGIPMGAKYLMDSDVIFVTINYRLGILGFLSTEDEVVPGNMGLKDQSMALRWVSENIEWFGGNPKRITLIGLSAGGASVHYHYLSPLSAGLFQGGISISGTALNCWTQTENSLEKAKQVGAFMGCPTRNVKEMIRCLRYRPARAIVETLANFMRFYYNPFTPFGPVTEKVNNDSNSLPFIDRTPIEIINSGDVQDVPWVTGVTSEEGLYPVAEFIAKPEALKLLDENWDLIAPYFLDYNYTIPKEKHVEVARLIRNYYFESNKIDETTLKHLIDVASDRFFITDGEKAARMQAKVNRQPVWFYYYTYKGAHSISEIMSGTSNKYGVCHADDAYMVVDTPFLASTTTTNDIKMQKVLIDFWVSFVNNGVPNVNSVQWPRLNPNEKSLHYLHIAGPGKIQMDSSTNFGREDFWNSINFNENKLHTSDTLKEEL
ncbi:juvenile hormone esterase precursor [Apis mellifera caucasica]|uniref:Carboxylic ester hydrolase n=1 Tax=Apis mellifera TaxID=7460 RepID=Q76LA5_APIME|nr:juvenile hormone esterase precursor [Apis mellifera]AAU81605.1 juvenile hormone esterase [Apis mellifera]KAG6796126.1 juvenile hormone esterase precursor [Apis mellifera caucasica]KAG9433318.1 juvenile hormone esterase precursor [Apis mellifera carnica]BAC54130.1 esterase [Apis mellifera]|eukprot:NP_001011563.1 juvenile hormone esterase precursor [Apis mellifera]